MDDIIRQFEEARGHVQSQVDQARQRHIALAATIDEIRQLTATAHSPRNEVSVTAAASGAVVGVAFGSHSLSNEALGALVTETIARAQQLVRDAAAERMEQASSFDTGFTSDLRAPLWNPKGNDVL